MKILISTKTAISYLLLCPVNVLSTSIYDHLVRMNIKLIGLVSPNIFDDLVTVEGLKS